MRITNRRFERALVLLSAVCMLVAAGTSAAQVQYYRYTDISASRFSASWVVGGSATSHVGWGLMPGTGAAHALQ